MKLKLLFLFIGLQIGAVRVANAEGPNTYDCLVVNDSTLFCTYDGGATGVYLSQGWMGSIYQVTRDSIINNCYANTDFCEVYIYTFCNSYIYPGDSVNISYKLCGLNRTYYSPGCDSGTGNTTMGCGSVSIYCYLNIAIQYLPDTLMPYYLNHFDSHYIDSVKTAAAIEQLLNGRQSLLYPNPTTGLLNLSGVYSNPGAVMIKVYDLSGKELLWQNYDENPGPQTNTLDLSILPDGIYLVEYTVKGNRSLEKIVKM